jgi:hypothetical protein
MTQWRDIPGFEGCYRVSDDGQVKNLEREVRCGHRGNGVRTVPERILKDSLQAWARVHTG